MGASIARKRTRLGRRVLRHQLVQGCASSCIMTCFSRAAMVFRYSKRARIFFTKYVPSEITLLGTLREAQWPIGYGVRLRIKRSSVRIRPWPLRWVLGQGSLLPLSQGEAFTLASISYLAILVKYIMAKKKKKFRRARNQCVVLHTVHSVIFFQNFPMFDLKISISGPIELKFSGKTL